MRRLFTAVSALAIGLLAAGPTHADPCKEIDTLIQTHFATCAPNESPVDFCTEGSIASGPLAGSTRFAAQTMTVTDNGILYTGVLTITTRSGTVTIHDSGVLNPTTGEFFEIDQVVGGTGRFKHVTGLLTSQGTETVVNGIPTFIGTLTGSICRANEGHQFE
jgi:hypothetical protein